MSYLKAVIMAGGKGTRLRPLTCNKPKPMVPLLNRPVMEYAIELLKKHRVQDIAVTLQYLPEVIKNYFGEGAQWGVNLQYFEEIYPLGTAGSVKNAESFLDETFIVISGDGLTDINLTEAIRFHKQKRSMATLVLTRVESPLEYGVVITSEDGYITRFLEKPSWSEVFSDTVNTGIYILEPEIFNYCPADTVFDFSKDLFPLLLKEKLPMYGFIANGYWCDIGNLGQYRQTQFDMLDSKVDVNIYGREIATGIWVGQSTQVEINQLNGPCFVGDYCELSPGANIGEYTIIGNNNLIKDNVSIKRSVVWNGNYIDREAELKGTTVANNCTLKDNVALFEGSVLGDNCIMEAKTILRPNIKLWPNKHVEENSVVHASLIWGDKISKNLFGLHGVLGIANVEITPDYVSKLATAYGSTLKQGSLVVLGGEGHPFAQTLKKAFVAGLLSAGVNTIDIGGSITPATRFAIKALGAQGGIHVRFIPPTREDKVLIEFMDFDGVNIDKGLEKKIENAYYQEDFRRAPFNQIGLDRKMPQFGESYITSLIKSVDKDTIKARGFRVVVEYDHGNLERYIPKLLARLGCQVLTVSSNGELGIKLQDLIKQYRADLGISVDRNGERLTLFSDSEQVLNNELLMAVLVLISFQLKQQRVVAVPVTAPEVMEKLAKRLDGQIIRTKANPRALMEVTAKDEFQIFFDGLYALVCIMEYMAVNACRLNDIVNMIPNFYLQKELVPCSWAEKGKVMRRLIEDTIEEQVELVDGVKVYHKQGWTLVLPDSDEPVFKVLSEASSQEVAKEMAASFAQKIQCYKAEV